MQPSPRSTFAPSLLSLLVLALVVATSATAFAKSSSSVELYTTGNPDYPALLHDDSGVIFIGKDLTPYRAYQWKQNKSTDYSRPFYIEDLDNDGKVDFIGAGTPTFMLNNSADPIWFNNTGCDQLLLADFTADDKPDLACVKGTSVRVATFDNQMVWELNLGKRVDFCRADDLNGDLKADLECKYAGAKSFVRLDGNSGKVIALDSPEEKITKTYSPKVQPLQPVTKDSLPAELGEVAYKGTPLAYLSQDLNGDGKNDIIVITDKEITIRDGAKTKEESAHFSSNAKKYKRIPVASLQDTYIDGFQKNEDATAALTPLQEKLAQCYAANVKKSPFAGSGRLIFQSKVDDKGQVANVQTIYSSLADKKIVTCASDAIKKAEFGPAKEGTQASVNMTILYSFKSQ